MAPVALARFVLTLIVAIAACSASAVTISGTDLGRTLNLGNGSHATHAGINSGLTNAALTTALPAP
jgi:hypothetical protein